MDSGQCYWWAGQAARRLSFRALPLGSNTGSGDNRSGRQHMNQALRSDALRISSSHKGGNAHPPFPTLKQSMVYQAPR